MFVAQLAQFLAAHHHHAWAIRLPIDTPRQFAHALRWALRHGFRYQP